MVGTRLCNLSECGTIIAAESPCNRAFLGIDKKGMQQRWNQWET
jgi:hypothetical protein